MSDLENPRLRPVDVIPVQQGQQRVYVLRDRSGLQEEQVAVSGLGAAILPMLDGEHAIREIQVELTRRSGQLVMSDHVEGILRQLDDAHLLDTPALEAFRQEKLAGYRESGVRRSRQQLGYPSEPAAFAEMTKSWMQALPPRERALDGSVVGAIAPHIDFERGSVGYAHAYRDLADACGADLFIVIGTDHAGDTQFAATRNDFETGLGRVKTAGDVLDAMEERFIGDLFEGELGHVGEHTIEFQVVLLQHFIDHDFEVVPLLCGGFAEEMMEGELELQNAEALCMADVLRDVVENSGRKVCVIASADLSHVGPQFGLDRPLTSGYLEGVEKHDRRVLELAMDGDPDAMFTAVAERRNDTNICGLGPIYLTVKALGDCRRELLHYGQATSPDRQQSVSFAAATFSR